MLQRYILDQILTTLYTMVIYYSENAARSDMKKVPILPTRTLKEHPSINYCEDMVIGHYRGLEKMKKGQAIVE